MLRRLFGDSSSFPAGVLLRPHYAGAGVPAEGLLEFVERAVREEVAHFFVVADEVVGDDGLSTPALAKGILERGGVPVISLAQGVRERAEFLDRVREYRDLGVGDLIVVSGDYPPGVKEDRKRALFDLDSVQLLMLLREAGLGELHLGCVVSPFKKLEAEQVWQYGKLQRKVEVGAGFAVSQAGFDLRKYDELARYRRLSLPELPLVASVIVPDFEMAGRIGEGLIPGLSIPPALMEGIAAEEKGGEGRKLQLRAAGGRMAVLRGLGYDGVLFGGALDFDGLRTIVEEAGAAAGRWKELLAGIDYREPRFYYFQRNEEDGLNTDELTEVQARRRPHLMYMLSYAIDYLAFGSWKPLYSLLVRVCRFCDARPFWKRALWIAEYFSKAPMYGCRMCGDCTLYACGFLCYEAGCPKRNLNGPCGGSVDGFCEIYPGREWCFWVRVYDCLKWKRERPTFTAPAIPPKDRRLDGTCSWISFCLGRDHRKMGGS